MTRSSTWQAIVQVAGPPMAFADFLERDSTGISVFEHPGGGWAITVLYRDRPDMAALGAGLALIAASESVPEPALSLSEVPHEDWLALAYAGFPARKVDR